MHSNLLHLHNSKVDVSIEMCDLETTCSVINLGNMAELSTREALSGALGSVSLAAWILVLVPQLVENYKAKNAKGISLAFLAVWFIGDLTNLLGAIWARLVPTVVALAFYFCLADAVLILQCLYYNHYYLSSPPTTSATQVNTSDNPRRPS